MENSDIQKILQEPYDRYRWGKLLHEVFPGVSLFEVPQRVTNGKPAYVEDYAQIGSVRLADGKNLTVFEIRVANRVNLLRNRVGLRDLVARHIDQGTTHGVLCVFSSSSPEYRFTFVCKDVGFDERGAIVTTETNPSRYTYILGPGEIRRTAALRFGELARHKSEAGLKEVMEAFSVERLNKEFFTRYKECYQSFVEHLVKNTSAPARIFGVAARPRSADYEVACKPVRDWVKKLLGRIVFIHFIQKKGWMGCPPKSKQWRDGAAQFLLRLFEQCRDKEKFHSAFLCSLFFDTLNTPDRPGDLFEGSGTRVPYLNGGLFEERLPEARTIDFPAHLFEELLEFFASYNFTIDENDPEEHEVGIDPGMLGHIFENLLEENKDKGAFYTPKPVVQFMCQQALLLYLQTHLGEQQGLEGLVRYKEAGENGKDNWVRQHASRIETLLDAVTVCDPAIGSGAFPIGMLHEIFWIKLALDRTLNDPAKFADIKRRIIEHTIHGVDIDPGAVEIARLRCWLSLIVDEVDPRPLPNLDFKIHCADSLIEYLRGEPVNLNLASSLDLKAQRAIQNLVEAKGRLFKANRVPEKRAARTALYSALVELGQIEFTWLRNQTNQFNERALELSNVLKDFTHLANEITKAPRLNAATQDRILAASEQWFGDASKPTFAWQLHFGEVFASGGFDVIIANPPFVKHETISQYKKKLCTRYGLNDSRVDLYVFFYELSYRLSKPNGIIALISSNKFYRASYGTRLRTFLVNDLLLHQLIDFRDAPIFHAIAYASIVLAEKTKPSGSSTTRVCTWPRTKSIDTFISGVKSDSFLMPQASLDSEGWLLEQPANLSLLKKLKTNGTSLLSYVNGALFRGIITGLNEAFVIDEDTKARLVGADANSSKLIQPWIRGRDVKRWTVEWDGLYVIVFPFGFHIQLMSYPAILHHLEGFKAKLRNRGQCRSSRGASDVGQHHWLELDNNPKQEYLSSFEDPKIIIPAIERRASCVVDRTGFYCNDKTTICLSNEPDVLCAVLNSAVIWWFLRNTAASRQNGYYELKPMYLRNVPVPKLSAAKKVRLSELSMFAHAGQSATDEARISEEIDEILFDAFDLSAAEMDIVREGG